MRLPDPTNQGRREAHGPAGTGETHGRRSCRRPQLAAQGDLADTLPTDCWLAGALMKLES